MSTGGTGRTDNAGHRGHGHESESGLRRTDPAGARRALLASCIALLGWDEETYMPRGGAEHRADQLASSPAWSTTRPTDPRLGELLADVEDSDLVPDPCRPRRSTSASCAGSTTG